MECLKTEDKNISYPTVQYLFANALVCTQYVYLLYISTGCVRCRGEWQSTVELELEGTLCSTSSPTMAMDRLKQVFSVDYTIHTITV